MRRGAGADLKVMTELLPILRRPVPVPDADSAPFWDACREQRLTVQECTTCGRRRFPPVGICHHCRGWSFRWVEVSQGTIYSWVVIHQSPIESLRADVPYIVAVIDLGDGVRIPTQLVGITSDELHDGMAVTVYWQKIDGGMSLPYFTSCSSTHRWRNREPLRRSPPVRRLAGVRSPSPAWQTHPCPRPRRYQSRTHPAERN
jgi:uncharacterized OB-fold protein